MKILLLGDLHFGVKQDDPWMQNIQRLAIEQAINYSKLNGIKQWIQTGDWFDTRKAITHKCMEFTREIADSIVAADISVDVDVGNHDMQYKQKIHPNACTELLSQFKGFRIFDKIQTVDYDGVKFDICPWICDENKEEILKFVEKSDSEYCVGHFELTGYYFYKGLKSHGDDPAFLRRYKNVFSGHFHTQSESRNVRYLGTPYSITSGDEEDSRGFWVFDTDTKDMTFVENNVMWHRKIVYPSSINPNAYKDLSVRVFVGTVDKGFTKFENELESVVHELKVIHSTKTVEVDGDSDFVEISIASVPDLMNEYIECIPDVTDEDIEAAKVIAKTLYLECTSC